MITEAAGTVLAREVHSGCLLCGERNPRSLRLRFRDEGDGVAAAKLHPGRGLQGYDGILHGGVIAALLDEAMAHCLFQRGVRALTGELRVRYVRRVVSDATIGLRARVLSSKAGLFRLRAELVQQERVAAWAEAEFLREPALKASSVHTQG